MKKFLSILMVFALIFASMLVFASCGGNGDGDNGDDGGNDDSFELGSVTEQPSGYKKYENDNVRFFYPSNMTIFENVQGAAGSVSAMDTATGASFVVTYSEIDDGEEYIPMTLSRFESTYIAGLKNDGYNVTDYAELASGIYCVEYDRGNGIIINQVIAFLYNPSIKLRGSAITTTMPVVDVDSTAIATFINSIALFRKAVD